MAASPLRGALIVGGVAVILMVEALVGQPVAAEGQRTMDRTADGSTVTLVQGSSVRLMLPLNAGTGYEWRLLRRPAAIVAVVADAAGTEGAGRPGGRIQQAFHITGVAPGSAELSFGLVRPWEADAPPADRFGVTIDVIRP